MSPAPARSGVEPLRIVCINVGTRYGDEYVDKLFRMVQRNTSRPFRFTCYTDRDRAISPEIEQLRCDHWGIPGWFNKIKLFDREVLSEPHLFLDITMVIKSSLEPLLAQIDDIPQPIIGMKDWKYDWYGSMVVFVRPNDDTQSIWDAYAEGQRFPSGSMVDGDQDYVRNYLESVGKLGIIGYFEQSWFASYPLLRRLHERDPRLAQEELDRAIFVKFHRKPKMHDVATNVSYLKFLLRHSPLRILKGGRYLVRETRQWWS